MLLLLLSSLLPLPLLLPSPLCYDSTSTLTVSPIHSRSYSCFQFSQCAHFIHIAFHKTEAFYTNWIQLWFDCRWVSILARSSSSSSIHTVHSIGFCWSSTSVPKIRFPQANAYKTYEILCESLCVFVCPQPESNRHYLYLFWCVYCVCSIFTLLTCTDFCRLFVCNNKKKYIVLGFWIKLNWCCSNAFVCRKPNQWIILLTTKKRN